ncbi:MAG TPA: flagellar hook basal-body protein [Chloroflexota bacterium]|nr:flagellar hook basal-body protein [Chloroflexota bacterium]
MEIGILGVATAGLRAQQSRIDYVGQNLANADTTAYRALRPELVDVPANSGTTAGLSQNQTTSLDRVVELAGLTQLDAPGPIVPTSSPLDVALPANVYLAVQLPNGQTGYTRNGNLQVDSQGRLQVDGNLLASTVQIQPGQTSPTLDAQGRVLTIGPRGSQTIGTLPLVRIANPDQLQPLGQGIYLTTTDSGPAQPTTLSGGTDSLTLDSLEGSNVQIAQEFGNLIRAQRAYQVGTQMIRTWDDLASDTVQELKHS